MSKRRVGGNSRVLRKKRVKVAKKGGCAESVASAIAAACGIKRTTRLRLKKTSRQGQSRKQKQDVLVTLKGERSKLLKRQAAERMVLKEHTRELEARRQRIKRGENAKMERRELGKYIRRLQAEQVEKHRSELAVIEQAILTHTGRNVNNKAHHLEEWEDIDDDDDEGFGEDELHEMFAHLTT